MTSKIEQTTHKTAHLQIKQSDTRPKFTKELLLQLTLNKLVSSFYILRLPKN